MWKTRQFLTPVGVGGGVGIRKLSQTVRHALNAGVCRGESGVRLDGAAVAQSIFMHRGVLLFIFLSRLNRASAISWMRLPCAASAGSRSSLQSVSQQACTYEESAARRRVPRFDRPVNRYKWFNTLGHFSRCWGTWLFAIRFLAFILFWSK